MKETDFANDAEQEKWMMGKVAPYARDDMPPIVFEGGQNFKLDEYYFEHSKGKDVATITCVEEDLSRTASDMNAGAAILQLEAAGVGKKTISPEEKHKQLLGKLQGLIKRLGATIGSTESSLPSLKRKLSSTTFGALKQGLHQSRDFKEQCLDRIEDMKVTPVDKLDGECETMIEMQREVKEHTEALMEVVKSHSQQAPIKRPHDEASDADAFDSRSPMKKTTTQTTSLESPCAFVEKNLCAFFQNAHKWG